MDVFCEICGKKWDSRDPAVSYIYGDGRWECYSEVECFARYAALAHQLIQAKEAGQWVV